MGCLERIQNPRQRMWRIRRWAANFSVDSAPDAATRNAAKASGAHAFGYFLINIDHQKSDA
jgi:hypothetical protein